MNPRVSRSSALASKATGFPIAKIAALLAVGYTLDEIPNDITGKTYAAFEPTLDYTVVKIPRWAFEKFPAAPSTLGTSMKSVGEVMAIGGTFREALQKAIASLELDGSPYKREAKLADPVQLRRRLTEPNWERMFAIFAALRQGWTVAEIAEATSIDPWFLREIREIVELESELACWDRRHRPRRAAAARQALGHHRRAARGPARTARRRGGRRAAREHGIVPVFKRIDTCAAEFPALTPYMYSTYAQEDESAPSDRPKILILGSGPNRIGQGIEFDYCCVHAAFALSKLGYETIMVNCNPETVSTDYDTSDRLYFEPLTLEHVLGGGRARAADRRGGPARRADAAQAGARARGGGRAASWAPRPTPSTWPRTAGASARCCARRASASPSTARPPRWPRRAPRREAIGYPVMVRPSYVLGGRAMRICHDEATLVGYMNDAAEVSAGHPVLLDRFLEDAVEVDLDLLCDGKRAVVCGILQHIEEAGIHSGDSAAVLPPYSVSPANLDAMRDIALRLAVRLGVVGLMNVQFAVRRGEVFVLEVNPRASRTVPFIAKAVGVPLVALASQLMVGKTLEEIGFTEEPAVPAVFVKAPVFPFSRFPGVDPVLGPEMKSTGEVMGWSPDFGSAFAKALLGAGVRLPVKGAAFLSVHDRDKPGLLPVARRLAELGFELLATWGTAEYLQERGLDGARRQQGARGAPARRRPPDQRRHPPDHQHADGPRVVRGRRAHPHHGAAARHPLHHHALGSDRGGRGHRGAAGAAGLRRAVAAVARAVRRPRRPPPTRPRASLVGEQLACSLRYPAPPLASKPTAWARSRCRPAPTGAPRPSARAATSRCSGLRLPAPVHRARSR